ncbi:hypothetical protein PYCC9005_002212 [Savitreella phatthalungensis]
MSFRQLIKSDILLASVPPLLMIGYMWHKDRELDALLEDIHKQRQLAKADQDKQHISAKTSSIVSGERPSQVSLQPNSPDH